MPSGVKPAGRQIDGSHACDAINVLVGKVRVLVLPARMSALVGG